MSSLPTERQIERLRRQAESAMRRGRGADEVEPLLDRLARLAPDASDDSGFAHRHLAELRIERAPWLAALHLRRVQNAARADDVVHALLGLSHALLGNFRAACSAYRRALALAPRNPWYHHNLGHLLDVALALPAEAEPHLRTAHRLEPLEDEITASLAHCLGMRRLLEEARELADEAVRAAPQNLDHKALLAWIENGAVASEGPHNGGPPGGARGKVDAPVGAAHVEDASSRIVRLLERQMTAAGFTPRQLERARALWMDFRDGRHVRVQKPEVVAAAIEYAISIVHGIDGVTRADVARRYGVGAASVSSRWLEIRDALALRPGDPRYAVS